MMRMLQHFTMWCVLYVVHAWSIHADGGQIQSNKESLFHGKARQNSINLLHSRNHFRSLWSKR